MTTETFAIGLGTGACNANGEWLECFYPLPMLHPSVELDLQLREALGLGLGNAKVDADESTLEKLAAVFDANNDATQATIARDLKRSRNKTVITLLQSDSAPDSVPEVYLKLHLISHRLCRPHTIDLSGLFAVLPNVAWTNSGAVDLNEPPKKQLEARIEGSLLEINSVDKFPKMTDYVVPGGVRIADTARVRLGAYIGEGTTIMHEGFVNFNAGTTGPGMIEGRISAGVMVGSGSDLGGGCSTMGTLSGGGNVVISVGDNCLIGANAGIGISLGDRCTVEAGLYLTAGTKVTVLDDHKQAVDSVAARELSGQSDLLFRRNSLNGAVECLTNRTAIELNEALHANN